MKRPRVFAAAACVALIAGASALAHGGAEGIVKERMEAMKEIAGATKAIAQMLKGETAYGPAGIRANAQTIAGHGGEALVEMFPEGTDHAPSEAGPAIWSEPERFAALAERLSAVATALAEAADNPRGGGMGAMMQGGQMGDMMGEGGPSAEQLATMPPDAAFMHLAQTCKACHQDFRVER